MKHFKASSVLFLINIIFSSFFWAQDEQPYPPLNLVSIPDLGFLDKEKNGRSELILQIVITGDFEDLCEEDNVKQIENWKPYSLV